MFEGVVASLFNRYLGKYVEDLDLENLNVGIFSGNVVLENLKLKPEALYELGLPITVKIGTVGKLSLNIPWNRLCSQTSVITVEEVYVLACPAVGQPYDPELEKKLSRAEKKRVLSKLDPDLSPLSNGTTPENFTETLVTSILNNLKIYIRNVHIRYEDAYTDINMPISFGLCIHNFSVETTNSKWKPISHSSKMGSVYQVVKLESFSIYCNANCSEILLNNEAIVSCPNSNWINCMRRSLETFSMFGESFDFIVKPISARIKVIINKSNEPRIPKLLVDFVLQDAALQLSHQQYLAITQLSKSFPRITVNRLYRKFHPGVPVLNNAKKWWKYAYDSVVFDRVLPYTWANLSSHRKNYRSYCHIYRSTLLDSSDTETKVDLQRAEDLLDVCNVIIAREHTKVQFRKENPERVMLKELPVKWWLWNSDHPDSKLYKLCVNEKKSAFWSLLSQAEKNSLCDIIGFSEADCAPDKPKQYIEHKFNFTIANLNFSLLSGGSETLVIAMSHILSSIETRPSAKAYKLSARIETLVIEGASVEYGLIPIITSENFPKGKQLNNFLILDFEKNPLNSEVDYSLSISSESVEVIYHEFSMSSFASFLRTPTLSMESASASIWKTFTNMINSMASGTVSRRCIFQLNVDMKLPHFIIPEYGSLQKNGKIIIIDLGRLKIWSDLQLPDTSLEDATQLELEEKLYDRFYFSVTEFQIMMFENDHDWRNFKKIHSSQFHILSKINSQIVFSNSIKPESKQLPRYKLNVSLQKFKINMSDSRIVSLINFINNVPSPKSYTVLHLAEDFSCDHVCLKNHSNILRAIQHVIACSELRKEILRHNGNKEELKKSFLTVDGSALSSEVSDEDSEIWAKILDLPGFDDNVSQNNVIIYLFRINIVQIIVELKRSSNNVDKPYIILHLVNFCCDTAFMEYGPAVQISLGSMSIVDKLHNSINSNFTQILSTEGKPDVISILYRKVRSDCPDFKSHFHSVEQSLVVEINPLQMVFHKEALVDLYRYLQYFSNKFKNRSIIRTISCAHICIKQLYKRRLKAPDPPIPPGATKFSYSARIADVNLQLCDTEIDFLLIKVAGFELDCMFKTDERLIFRAYLMTLSIDDISSTSLYPKILSVEEEKLLEIKYIRRSPRLSKTNIESNKDEVVKSDGVFKLQFSRIHLVLMYKLIYDVQKFFSPFIPAKYFKNVINLAEKSIAVFLSSLRFYTDKIHMSIDFQFPTLLLPQQASSPNLVLLNLGDLTVENFFKELRIEEENRAAAVIDNALIKLDSISVSRAIVNFSGAIIVQENIVGPVCCKTDVKRLLLSSETDHDFESLPFFEIHSTVDVIEINLGQKDLRTLNLIWFDSIRKMMSFYGRPLKTKYSDTSFKEEIDVRKLQEFFYQTESNRKQVVSHMNFEGLLMCLYSDFDEILSSPLRDENRSLCKLRVGETAITGVTYTNGKTEYQLSVQSLLLEDTRVHNPGFIKRIFQSYGATNTQSNNENVSITVPPVISITLHKNQLGESHCNVLIDHTRLNVAVAFVMELFRFFIEAIPFEQDSTINNGVVNYGYMAENCEYKNGFGFERRRSSEGPPSYLDESGGLSLSITCRKPEIMFFSLMGNYVKNHALLLRADLSVEYVRHPTNISFICNVSEVHMLSKLQSTLVKSQSDLILKPCNIEISKNWAAINEETKISISCDKINLHISASTVHTTLNIIEELDSYLFVESMAHKFDSSENFYQECDDLWSAKKITPYCLPQKHESMMEQSSTNVISESMIISIPSVKVMFEIEDIVQKKPVLLLKMRSEAKLRNWSNSLEMKGDLSLQCSYFNCKVNAWEPVLEPCMKTENIYRPWEISIKAFKSKSYPISIIMGQNRNAKNANSKKKVSVGSTKGSTRSTLDSETSAGEDDVGSVRSMNKSKLHTDKTDYQYSDNGSDSENEDTIMEKLKTRFGQLLIGESSDENTDSDSDISLNGLSINNNSDDNSDDDTMSYITNNSFLLEKRAIFITKQRESADSGLDSGNYDKSATYIIMEAQERFELVMTPSTISIVKQILDSFSLKFNNILTDTQILSLKNDIAPNSTVTLKSKSAVGPMKILMCANYSLSESSPSSPGSTIGSPCNGESPTDFEFNSGIENFEGGFSSDAYAKMDGAKRKSDGDIILNALQFPRMSVDVLYTKVMDRQLHISVNGFDDLIVICPTRTTNKYHALTPVKNNIRYYVVVSSQNDLWGHAITVRSPLQMKNETCFPIALYYKKNALDNTGFDHIGELTNPFEDSFKFAILEPDEVYNLPIMITYHCTVYILPIYEDYHLSEFGLWWKELANDITTPKDVICKPKNEKSPVFAIRAVTNDGVYFSNSCSRAFPNYMIRLVPPIFVYNLLPCAFQIKIPTAEFSIRIEAGGKSSIYSVDMSTKHAVSLEVPIYFGISWNGTFHLCNKMEEKMLCMTTDQDTEGGNKHLTLNVRMDKAESYNVMIYSPYWIVNKTGLPLQLKGSLSDVVYETLIEESLFFSFKKTQKKNIRLRVYQSSWSSAFSIDTAGCSGLITCRDKERNRNYHILVEITLSRLNPQLTKIVTLLPYFLISNECQFSMRYMEENEQADLWIDLPQNQTIPFWPETNSMKMYIKYRDSSLVSQHFFINQACQTVLRMDKGSAVVVDVEGGDNKPFLIIFQDYKAGDAPVRIDNFCEDLFLKISQEHSGQVTLLSPYQSLLYTWDDPTLERKLQWNVYNRKNKGFMANFKTDGYGQEYVSFKLIKQQTLNSAGKSSKLSSSLKKFTSKYTAESSSSCEESERDESADVSQMIKTHKGKVVVYWVCYLEGAQRVLLFTQDEQVAFYAFSRIDSERSNIEFFLSIKGIGLSLVGEQNNVCRELAYVSVNDSASIWEVNIAHSWKILPLELATWIEHQWSQGAKKAQLKDYVNVDLEKMQLIKPFFGELKRTYQPAFWIHCRKSLNYYYFQWKIHKFQVDNQLPNSAFQSVVYPKIIPYDVIRKYGLKPCIEGTFVKKRNTLYERNVYKYIKFVALEFCVQVDKHFILSLYELFHPWLRCESSSLRIRADICKVHHPLIFKFQNDFQGKRKTVVEFLYFSPIKIQFSFTSQNVQHLQSNLYNQPYVKALLDYVLNCITSNYVDFKGVKLKCPYFEESGLVTHMTSKFKEIRRHYCQTLIQQIYTHIFGVSVSYNSSNEMDLCEEYVDFYYDLSLAFLKKVDEFAEAISEAARCLLSHVTSSSTNSTSSLIMCGKRISLDLGLNPEIIKKKSFCQQLSFEEPEEVLKGDTSFEIGVLYGLSGVLMNPPTCNQLEGAEQFFRTVGKHLLRLLNKYSNTITNMPITAIDGIKRAAETGTDITFRRRLPKYINPFGMKPFSVHHAIGLNILNSINKGIYSETDDYWTHVVLTSERKSCLLITLQRIFYMTKIRLWDEWKIEWYVGINDITEVPRIVDNKLFFKIRQEEAMSNLYSDDKMIEHSDVNLLFWIQKMIEIVFIINLENKPCCFVESRSQT